MIDRSMTPIAFRSFRIAAPPGSAPIRRRTLQRPCLGWTSRLNLDFLGGAGLTLQRTDELHRWTVSDPLIGVVDRRQNRSTAGRQRALAR